jgi:putative peptidoglycan lipid II flippase
MAVSGAVVLAGQDVATAVVLRLANDEGSRGSVVLYNLAWTVFLLPWAVLAVPLATSAFPTLTARWGAGDRAGYGAAVTRVLRVTAAVTAVAAAVMAAASGPVARLVVLGAPGHVAPTVLARGLATFAPGALAFGLTAALSRALYAQHDARTPAFAASGGWLAAIALDIVLVRALPATWTVAAVGAATTVGLTLTGGWLVVALRRTAGPAATAGLWRTIAASVAAAGVGGAVGVAIERLLAPTTLPQSLGTTVLVTAVVVALASLVLIASDRPTARLIAARLAGLVPGARRREVTDG